MEGGPVAKKPPLSVVIPAYNAERFIAATIQSVLDQTVQEHEIIVVDDGSTDGTPDILADFGASIRTIRQTNQGLSAARNRGIAAATSEWLAFLDADDLWLPGFSENMLAAANARGENVGVIVCGWKNIDLNDDQLGVSVSPPTEAMTSERLLLGNAFPPVAAIVHRDWVDQVGGFDPGINGVQDWDFWLRLAYANCKFHSIPKVLVSYRQVPGSMSRQVRMMRDNGNAVLDKFYGQPSLPFAVVAVREKAYGLVRLWAGANFYDAGYPHEGFEEFRQALFEFPLLLAERETFHVIICAEQPRQHKGTTMNLDLVVAEARLQALLYTVIHSDNPPSLQLQRKAGLLAHQALAGYAFRQGHRRQALHHATLSLRYATDLNSVKQGTRLFAKAIVQPIPMMKEGE